MIRCKFCGEPVVHVHFIPEHRNHCSRCHTLWEEIRRMPIRVLNRIVVDARTAPNYIKPGDRR